MERRQRWTPEEDSVLFTLLSAYLDQFKSINWNQIQNALMKEHPEWWRTGKQCRQRWRNYLDPSLKGKENISDMDFHQFTLLIREHGTKWSMIVKHYKGISENALKNFYYRSLKKGIRNLNYFNASLRPFKIYKKYNDELIKKFTTIQDDRKRQEMRVMDPIAFQIYERVQLKLMHSSKHVQVTQDLIQFYEDLHRDVSTFNQIYRFKKIKNKQHQKHKDQEETAFKFPRVRKEDTMEKEKDLKIEIEKSTTSQTQKDEQRKAIENCICPQKIVDKKEEEDIFDVLEKYTQEEDLRKRSQ